MKYTPNGFRDTNNNNSNTTLHINTNIIPNNNNYNQNTNSELALTLNRERMSKSNKKPKNREDLEFPSIRSFQKDLLQKIYSKESGEILQILRKSNENIRSSKVAVYDNSSGTAFDNKGKNIDNNNNNKNNHNRNVSESQRLENSDNDYMHFFNPNNNFNNLDKFSSSAKMQSFGNNEEKILEDHLIEENNSEKKKIKANNNIILNACDESAENSISNFKPEMVGYKIKRKKKQRSDSNIFKSNNEKSSNDLSIEIARGPLTNRSEKDFVFNNINSSNNPINNMLLKSIGDNNIINPLLENNNSEFNQSEEKSVYLKQSSKNGFPKILEKISINGNQQNSLNNNNNNLNNLSSTLNNLNNSNNNNISNYLGEERKVRNNLSFLNNNSNSNIFSSNKIINNTFNHHNNKNNNNNDNNNNYATFLNSSSNNNLNQNNSHTMNSVTKTLNQKQSKFFCPHCEHCNIIKDENLEKYFNMKEAKSIVRKSLDFIVTNYQTDQNYLDFLLGNNNPGFSYLNYINANNLQQINTNNNLHLNNVEYENLKNLKNRTKFDIEVLLNTFPKHSNNRTVLQLVTHFLDALINDKVSLDSIAGPEMFERLKDSLISQGIAFKENEGEIEFDKELDAVFDEATKEKLRKLFKSKFFLFIKN